MGSTSIPILAFDNQRNDILKMTQTWGLLPIVLLISSSFKRINQPLNALETGCIITTLIA